ncbi:MAG: glycosyltransferase family 87 protein, partial [Anaerolineales bacterium]
MKTKKYFFFVLLFFIFFLVGAMTMFYLQNSLRNTTMILGVDMVPRWVGTQAVLHGESPYSPATRQQIWLEIYGNTEKPDGNLFGFYYPPAITTLLIPFVLTGLTSGLAAILWCAFLFAMLSTFLILWIANFRNHPRALFLLPTLLISGWLFRPAFSNYLLGQFALFSSLTAIAAWYFLEKDKPIWAGIFASISLVKPSLTILPIGYLFTKNWREPKGSIALVASSLLLYLPPTILLGWWLPDFLADISKYAAENRVAW